MQEVKTLKKGVLLINLGTPRSTHPSDVKRYLKEFLLDEKVVDLPWIVRQILVRAIIIPRRYRESAHLYQTIWMKEGSPLMVYGERVKNALQQELGEDYRVDLAMRYQEKSIPERIDFLLKEGVKELIFLPLFPQYAEATTGSILKKITEKIGSSRYFPSFRFISDYPVQKSLIEAFCQRIQEQDFLKFDHLLFSFHGLPVRQLKKMSGACLNQTDCCRCSLNKRTCYKSQCLSTVEAITRSLKIENGFFSVSFQSRLGKEEWIQPDTLEHLKELVKKGKKKILVVCPSFVADCIETLSEVEIEYKKELLRAGGEELRLVPALNAHPIWVQALKELVLSGS